MVEEQKDEEMDEDDYRSELRQVTETVHEEV